jgi:hypothetical protein
MFVLADITLPIKVNESAECEFAKLRARPAAVEDRLATL